MIGSNHKSNGSQVDFKEEPLPGKNTFMALSPIDSMMPLPTLWLCKGPNTISRVSIWSKMSSAYTVISSVHNTLPISTWAGQNLSIRQLGTLVTRDDTTWTARAKTLRSH